MTAHKDDDPRPTIRLDARDLKPSWALVNATLEQMGSWAPFAMRLGIIALAQNCMRELAHRDASGEAVVRLREYVEALAHMPFEK
jgi:hypothetical protein